MSQPKSLYIIVTDSCILVVSFSWVGATKIANMIRNSPTITYLNICHNGNHLWAFISFTTICLAIGDRGAMALGAMLSTNPTLKILKMASYDS
jgi:hypothetical protein